MQYESRKCKVYVMYYFSLAVFPYPKSRIAIFIGNSIDALLLEEYFEDHFCTCIKVLSVLQYGSYCFSI